MAKTALCTKGLPNKACEALRIVGSNLAVARKRRRWKLDDVAMRIHCTRQTVSRMEKGDPSVGIGTWIYYAFVLNLLDGFYEICKPENDREGIWLDKESRMYLQRIREKQDRELDF